MALSTLLSLTLLSPIRANAEQGTVPLDEKPYAPIRLIVKQMGGQVDRHEADKYTMITINGKTIRIDDTWGFAEVNGKFTPYETTVVNNWRVPTYKKPILKDGDQYVPVDFLKEKVGLALEVTGDKVTFNAVDGAKNSVATTNISSSSSGNSGSSSNVESNTPASSSTGNTSSGSSGSTATKPNGNSGGSSTPTPTPQPIKQTVYTGSDVKQKLYGLGFVNLNGGVTLNPYGANGNVEYTYMNFGVLSGQWDMHLTILNSTPEVDQKIRTICSYICPTQGDKLYSILDTPGGSETVTLDGRTISIEVASFGLEIDFGPMVK